MKTFLTTLLISSTFVCFSQVSPEQLAQRQLEAYNEGDIDKFLEVYSDSVKVYDFPNTPRMQGKENMRKVYSRIFENTPDLYCKLVSRIVMGNTVIDHESVTFNKDLPPVSAIAIYKVANEKISEVYFIMPEPN